MAEDKDNGNSGGWFPNFNHLLLVLLAGTLFVSQTPFHESRPGKTEAIPHSVHPVHARTWQDPFEEVNKYIEEHKDNTRDLDKLETLRDSIKDKASANGLDKIIVVAVMLPGAPYFEDSEIRRRLRYAVLSGFNAALRYMPDTSEHIYFFITKEIGEGPKSSHVAYEWMVYKPTKVLVGPLNNERHYERPPVLLLWLNDKDFSVTPHKKIQDLIAALAPQQKDSKSKIGQVSILGPFDSDGLQDLVGEMANANQGKKSIKQNSSNDRYVYFSPRATVQECNLLRYFPDFQDCHKLEKVNTDNIQRYFKGRLDFLRVTATDLHLARAIKAELKLRGIEPSEKNRILLVGEWDSLYDWHLSNTFTKTLLDDRGNYCRGNVDETVQGFDALYDHSIQCVFRASYLRGLDGEKQNAGGGKKSSSSQKSSGGAIGGVAENIETATGDSQFDYVRRLAEQIDKLDRKIRGSVNWSLYRDAHAIKAIGILGSDVYDKLLISEALHSKFPDALFFTNDMDARFLQPEHNEWARNMVIASGFGLQLDRSLQNGIPPFRDSTQTAYFLATEMALARQFKDEGDGKENPYNNANLWFDDRLNSLLRLSSQTNYDEKLFYDGNLFKARIFELGRTKAFDLSPPNSAYALNKTYLHPEPDKNEWDIGYMAVIFFAVCAALLFAQPSRQFLGQVSGLYFSVGMATVCIICLGLAFGSGWVSGGNLRHLENYCMLTSFILAIIYVIFISFVAITDENLPIARNRPSLEEEFFNLNILLSLASLAVALYVIWRFVEPQGWLDGYEPYALLEGVSMWPSQAIRLIAVVLAGYFIIEAIRFPNEFTSWLEKHFCLNEVKESQGLQSSSEAVQNHTVLDEWLDWKKSMRVRHYVWASVIVYLVEIFTLWFFGVPNVPSRGDSIFSLNLILLQGLLVPAALILLVVVSDHLITTVNFVEHCFPDDVEDNAAKWPSITLKKYATRFNLEDDLNDLGEWVGMRFIIGLTGHIYRIIGYPLVTALLTVLACFSYFDNWEMPVYIKLSIGLSLVWLLFWDHRLKKTADKARENALKSLRARAIHQQGDEQTKTRGGQLERLIGMIENYDAVVYKSFTQRPIFLNSLLIMIALLAGSVDYATLASNLFK
jgi:hypothetical protein